MDSCKLWITAGKVQFVVLDAISWCFSKNEQPNGVHQSKFLGVYGMVDEITRLLRSRRLSFETDLPKHAIGL